MRGFSWSLLVAVAESLVQERLVVDESLVQESLPIIFVLQGIFFYILSSK